MAKDFMASMLDELMGRDRDVEPEKRRELSFTDSDYIVLERQPLPEAIFVYAARQAGSMCIGSQKKSYWSPNVLYAGVLQDFTDTGHMRYFLVGFCPHDLFVNTKADLGPCKKIHDAKFKEQYEKSSRCKKLGYEEEFYSFLRDLSYEMDRKIKRANERVLLTNRAVPSGHMEEPQTEQREDAKVDLNKKINLLIAEANELGANGESDAAEAKMKELEKLKQEKRNLLELGLDTANSSILSIERKLEVCQVCGAYLVIGDAQQRIEDHLGGKQHSGFALVRRTLQEAETEMQRKREEQRKQREERYTHKDDDDDRNNGGNLSSSSYRHRHHHRSPPRGSRRSRSRSPPRHHRQRRSSREDRRSRDDRKDENARLQEKHRNSSDRSQRQSSSKSTTRESSKRVDIDDPQPSDSSSSRAEKRRRYDDENDGASSRSPRENVPKRRSGSPQKDAIRRSRTSQSLERS